MLQRIETRREYKLPMEVILPDWDEPVELVADDISPRGAFIRLELLPDVGDVLVCSFAVPGVDEKFCFFSKVTRVNMTRRDGEQGRFGFGVSFMDVAPFDRFRIRHALGRPRAADAPIDSERRGPFVSLAAFFAG